MMQNFDYLYDKKIFFDACSVEHFVEKKLSYKIYDNAYIMPLQGKHSGVYTEDKQFIGSSAIHNGHGEALSVNEVSASCFSDETVIYIGVLYGVWGHILTDDIKRFWFFKSEVCLSNFANCKIVYIRENAGQTVRKPPTWV